MQRMRMAVIPLVLLLLGHGRLLSQTTDAGTSAATDTAALFEIVVNPAKMGVSASSHVVAGDTVILNLTVGSSLGGVTYGAPCILELQGARGATVSGIGASDLGGGRALLNGGGWSAGRRAVVVKDTTAYDTLRITLVDSTSAGGPYLEQLDSVIVFAPAAYCSILVTAPDTVDVDQQFTVGVELRDQYGNVRALDDRAVQVTTNKLGVDFPSEMIWIYKGVGSFTAVAHVAGSGLTFRTHNLTSLGPWWGDGVIPDVFWGLSPPITVAVAARLVGPVAIDWNMTAGDQRQRAASGATPGLICPLQLHVSGVPDIRGWRVVIEYDSSQVRYLENSFEPSELIPDVTALAQCRPGQVNLGGTPLDSTAMGSGNGMLGTLSFEVLPGFTGETTLVISHLSLLRVDDQLDEREVRSTASLSGQAVEAEPLPGDLDGDGIVGFSDFFLLADALGSSSPGPLYDLSTDGAVDLADYFVFASLFGQKRTDR